MTAGPGFGYNRDVHLLPHKGAAWIFFGERLRQLATIATHLRTEHALPSEVEEAAAALQDLAEQFAPVDRSWSAWTELAELRTIEKALPCGIAPEVDGPYLVTNLENLTNSKGARLQARPEMALCRCGGSANKPFCDGTHARIGFASRKLPGRVEDRRDNYAAGSLTIHDNRGICQHSAYCTDELTSVFNNKREPWIDPNGASAERIIAQVRKCPSGALSYSNDGVEHRDEQRAPTVTISKDGPYRVTGGVALQEDAWGEGSSREHYTLCRCGGSKNKPFCDGTHWTNDFHDEKN